MKSVLVKLSLVIGVLSACGQKDKKGDTGSVKVSMANKTSLSLYTPVGSTGTYTSHGYTVQAYPATTYDLKMVQIYLIPDIDPNTLNNVGQAGYIWISPDCPTETDNSGAVMVSNQGNCDTSKIKTYFELARPSADVNAALNAQQLPVPAQTYKYIRLQLCDNQIPGKNARIASMNGGLVKDTEIRTGNCVFDVKIDPPLELGKDEAAEISLSYDLVRSLGDYNYDITNRTYRANSNLSEYCAVADDGKGVRCALDIDFSAAVSKK